MDSGIPEVRGEAGARAAAKVLVVDDDTRSLFAIERILEGCADQIVTARNGEQALKRVLEHDFALILLDVRMPGMDGYETASFIRKREKSRHIPIIFLTAVEKDSVHLFRGYSAGAVDYVFKPVEPLILKSKVNVFVDLFRKTEDIRREEELKRQLEAENFRVRSEKLRAEHALRLSEERQTLIIQSLPLALYSSDLSDRHAGPRFLGHNIERLCGFPAAQFQSEADFWQARIHPDDRERVLDEVSQIARDQAFATEYRWRCRDESYRCFFDRAVIVSDQNGVPHEIFGIWLDVTEHRKLEQQLVHAQKMDAVGRLTGGIAHDFGNMLTAVLGNLDLLRRSLPSDSKASRRANLALQSALRCADLTQRLRYLARQQPLQRSVVNVAEIVAGMMEILRRTLDESIEFEVRVPPDLWNALGDRSQLESALLNLIINARDAMPEGGHVTIELANVVLSEPNHDHNFDADPGDYVMLSVTDTGTGMSPAVLARILEPFFTTKEVGRGTGLGLSMTCAFLQQCGGYMKIASKPGEGTSVRMYLKRTEAGGTSIRAEDEWDPQRQARGGEIILVVEDDIEVLRATTEALRELGYSVIEAGNGRAALDILASGQHVDLLFTDITMPGRMSGQQLADLVAARHPGVRILYTSGYIDCALQLDEANLPVRLLRKPYRDFELAQAIRAVLDGDPPSR